MEDSSSPRYRVLIVDDSEASAKTLGWMLEMLGHEAQLAHDGKQAIAAAKSYNPDIILLDIGLPEMNGYEVCQALRRDPQFRDTLMIAQTGWGQKEHLDRARQAGFNHHLLKPIKIEALQQLLEEVNLAAA